MAVDRAPLLDRRFLDALDGFAAGATIDPAHGLDAPIRAGSQLTARAAIDLFDAQVASRHLDLAARALRARGEGFYTIGSSRSRGQRGRRRRRCGRPTRRCCTTARAAFYVARARQVAGHERRSRRAARAVRGAPTIRSPAVATRCSAATRCAIPPQTSTIASHLPRALGVAFAIGRARAARVADRRGGSRRDVGRVSAASATRRANHSTAQGAINAAACTASTQAAAPAAVRVRGQRHRHQRADAGRLDRGHVRPPARARATSQADGARSAGTRTTPPRERPTYVRTDAARRRSSTCAPCACMGHAGTDVEPSYRTAAEIEADEAAIRCSRPRALLDRAGAARPPTRSLGATSDVRARGRARCADEAARRPTLASADEVMAPLAPRDPAAIAVEAARQRAAGRARGVRRTPAARSTRRQPRSRSTINRTLGESAREAPGRCSCSARTSRRRAASTA